MPLFLQCEELQRKLSSHYEGLIRDQDVAIQQLARDEEALRHQLDDRSQNERELRRERKILLAVSCHTPHVSPHPPHNHAPFHTHPFLKVNQYLKERLKESNDKLRLGHGLIHRLNKVDMEACSLGEESFMVDEELTSSPEGSLSLEDCYFTPPSISLSL